MTTTPEPPTERPLPLYVVRVRRRARVYLYFRWKGLYRRLPDDPASDAFKREYAKAFASISPEHEKPIIHHSVRALIRDFKTSPEYRTLAPKTQADYARMLDHLAPYGDFQADNVRRQHVILARNRLSNTRTQDLFVQAVSRMFSIGIDLGYTERNPAMRIPRLNDPDSYEPWTLADHRKFRASNPPEWMMTAYMLGLWLAQREGDILRLGPEHFDGVGFTIRQGRPEAKRGKGRKGAVVTVYIVAAKPLRDHLASCTVAGRTYVTDEAGDPIGETDFRHRLRAHLDNLGLVERHFHGLRHTTATALAELGGSDAEIQALLGHQTRQMAERYTKKAARKRLAASAIKKLEEGWDVS